MSDPNEKAPTPVEEAYQTEPEERGAEPAPSEERQAPEPERPATPQEKAGSGSHQVDDPPQAEGERRS